MQGVHSIVSINLYAEDKEHFLFAYDAPMTFQIHFCLTINPNRWLYRLSVILGCFHCFLLIFRLLVGILSVLFSRRSPLRLQE